MRVGYTRLLSTRKERIMAKETKVCSSWKFSDKEVTGKIEEIGCIEESVKREKKPVLKTREKPQNSSKQ